MLDQYDRLKKRNAFMDQYKKEKMFENGLDEFDDARSVPLPSLSPTHHLIIPQRNLRRASQRVQSMRKPRLHLLRTPPPPAAAPITDKAPCRAPRALRTQSTLAKVPRADGRHPFCLSWLATPRSRFPRRPAPAVRAPRTGTAPALFFPGYEMPRHPRHNDPQPPTDAEEIRCCLSAVFLPHFPSSSAAVPDSFLARRKLITLVSYAV